ncbi:E3 ubiquitin/ISG15 ligase TRIM25 isoform X3 [Salminus brasiliensis]|uniref:E3 ubiquitin/ISG15 ligase TRIM25 isoform X3 n=1 Tax=Salminus brasiliensis TaxID=930266 RepID=UPI003B8318F3
MATSLLNLEEDLTCSICLCPFDGPVSLACGHSFCQQCLEAAWRNVDPVSCPHCRTLYTVRPELKRNTVLSAVVDTIRSASDAIMPPSESVREVPMAKPKPKPEPKPVLCDTCMVAKAESTCMTCAASFCSEHVRPHRDNPVYRAHRLVEPPLADLQHRLCAEHAKLLEFYCVQHERSMCSGCLQEQHRGCAFCPVEEQRGKTESEMRDKLGTLDCKIEKNQLVISQMREQQAKLKDIAAVRKRALEAEYQQLRDLLQRDESEAMKALEKDLETGQTKLSTLMKKFSQNIEKMNGTKDEIHRLLTQSDSMDFLQASVDMPSVVAFDPYAPRINLDSKAVIAYHACVVSLKEQISKILSQPVENRLSLLKPESEKADTDQAGAGTPPTVLPNPRERGFGPNEAFSPPRDPGAAKKKPQRKDNKGEKKDSRGEQKDNRGQKKDSQGHKEHRERREERANRFPTAGMTSSFSSMDRIPDLTKSVPDPADMRTFVKRNDLLKYGTILMFDQRTAHRRVALSENNTKASVSDEPSPYPEIPARFTVCSQVLCSKGFTQGRHYWEVKMSSNNFCGIGLAYGSMDRKGPCSRLGRNAQSWCVEWFNVKLSAWHRSEETVLSNPNPSRVGVLLDCDEGSATFYSVSDRAYPFHTFVFHFSEPVYPAFWIFSSGSSINLCKLTN